MSTGMSSPLRKHVRALHAVILAARAICVKLALRKNSTQSPPPVSFRTLPCPKAEHRRARGFREYHCAPQ
jgi:hypothetical protein